MINEKDYERFFHHGINNKEELKEGIICFANQEVYNNNQNLDWYETPNSYFMKELIKKATGIYTQAVRFIDLNDRENSLQYDVNKVQIEFLIRTKIIELLQQNKMYESKAGIHFYTQDFNKLNGGTVYVYGKGIDGEEGWTKKIYKILKELDKLEKDDKLEYYDRWLQTKIARARDRENKEELEMLDKVYETFSKRKKRQKQAQIKKSKDEDSIVIE